MGRGVSIQYGPDQCTYVERIGTGAKCMLDFSIASLYDWSVHGRDVIHDVSEQSGVIRHAGVDALPCRCID